MSSSTVLLLLAEKARRTPVIRHLYAKRAVESRAPYSATRNAPTENELWSRRSISMTLGTTRTVSGRTVVTVGNTGTGFATGDGAAPRHRRTRHSAAALMGVNIALPHGSCSGLRNL